MEQRRLVEEGLSGQFRDDPAAALEDFMDGAKSVCLVGFPRIMTDQSRQQPGQAQHGNQQ